MDDTCSRSISYSFLSFGDILQFTSSAERLLFIVVRLIGETLGNTYGSGTGRIWLDNVNCNGSEAFIGNCPHNGWDSHNCDHDEDVSIRCRNITITTTAPPPSVRGTSICHTRHKCAVFSCVCGIVIYYFLTLRLMVAFLRISKHHSYVSSGNS